MAIPMPANVTVNIYRTANPSSPYSLGTLYKEKVSGYLEPRVRDGRHGSASWLKWTHVLYLDASLDVRDAYNSQLDPSRDNTKADTVIIKDTGNSNKVAYYVVFVEVIARNTPHVHLRAYLDRFQPQTWPNNAL